jgi:hypothetical protein
VPENEGLLQDFYWFHAEFWQEGELHAICNWFRLKHPLNIPPIFATFEAKPGWTTLGVQKAREFLSWAHSPHFTTENGGPFRVLLLQYGRGHDTLICDAFSVDRAVSDALVIHDVAQALESEVAKWN